MASANLGPTHLRHLRSFVTSVEALNLTKVAQKLRLPLPSLTVLSSPRLYSHEPGAGQESSSHRSVSVPTHPTPPPEPENTEGADSIEKAGRATL